jgi:hypothetical protein
MFKRIVEMGLSIAIVFLIGAMVVTEVMCDIQQNVIKVRALLETTVKRLKSGQTVSQNHAFIYLAIDSTDDLLISLSYPKRVNREAIGEDIHPGHVDRIVIGRIEDIQNEVGTPSPNEKPKIHVNHALEAIKYVLGGKFGSASDEIKQSKKTLPGSLSSSSSAEELWSHLVVPDYKVGSMPVRGSAPRLYNPQGLGGSSLTGTRPTVLSQYIQDQIVSIRDWLRLELKNLNVIDQSWEFDMMVWGPEIAYALINSLPNKYLTHEELNFIGRYPVEESEVIHDRISNIVHRITPMNNDWRMERIIVVLIDVLNAIRHILNKNWVEARDLITTSIAESRYDVPAAAQASFTQFMTVTYRL